VILDTKGDVFGGFTPAKWESKSYHAKADDNLKSFLFTLKNPHNIPARRFMLNTETKHEAINCIHGYGPCFYGLAVSENCNTNTSSYTYLGGVYINDTGLAEDIVLAGAANFQVKEIEVFEITD
jgi:hypothetical protein